ncbi:MAG: GNAT family N-acetyltransferase [Woeseiaceae bacterium]
MPFDLQPHLEGALLKLRPLAADDLPALFKVASDPLIWEQHPASDRYKRDVFSVFFDEALASGGALLALDTANAEVIGSSRYHGYSEETRTIEIGWTFLARKYWGGNYNREMKKLMLEHAYQFVDSVLLIIGDSNIRSQKAAEKIGARQVDTRADEVMGTSYVFEILKSDYLERPP